MKLFEPCHNQFGLEMITPQFYVLTLLITTVTQRAYLFVATWMPRNLLIALFFYVE